METFYPYVDLLLLKLGKSLTYDQGVAVPLLRAVHIYQDKFSLTGLASQ